MVLSLTTWAMKLITNYHSHQNETALSQFFYREINKEIIEKPENTERSKVEVRKHEILISL